MSFPDEATDNQRTWSEAAAEKFTEQIEPDLYYAQGPYQYEIVMRSHIRLMRIFHETLNNDHTRVFGMPLITLGETEYLSSFSTLARLLGKEEAEIGMTWQEDGRFQITERTRFTEFCRMLALHGIERMDSDHRSDYVGFEGFLSSHEAKKLIVQRLAHAISRELVIQESSSDTQSSPPLIEVHARQSGLSVEWAYAYLLDFTFFGHPTPVVQNTLSPGYCCFAGRRSGSSMLMPDPTKFDIPKTRKCVVTCF